MKNITISNAEEKEMLETLQCWAEINTHWTNLSGLQQLLTSIEKACSCLGGISEQLSLSDVLTVCENGEIKHVPVGKALAIKKRPLAPVQILLAGHMDTVFPPSCPFQKTTRISHEQLGGPGVADMKGGLVILLKSLELLERSPYADSIGWHVLLTPDEEIGSSSSEQILLTAAKKAHIGMIFEPAFPNGDLASERKGSYNFVVTAKGKAAHAGRDYHVGRNAIVALSRFIITIHEIFQRYPGITLNVGKIIGGEAANIVPAHASCHINVRSNSEKELNAIAEELGKLVLIETDGVPLTLRPLSCRVPKPFTPTTESLFQCMKQCAEELSIDLAWKPTGGVCDGNILAQAGLPTIDTLGAIGGHLHTYQEYIEIKSLVERAQMAALFLISLASKEKGIIHG